MNEFWSRYEQVLDSTDQLTVDELEDLVSELSVKIGQLRKGLPAKPQSQYGLWGGKVNLSSEEIAEARREMWGDYVSRAPK